MVGVSSSLSLRVPVPFTPAQTANDALNNAVASPAASVQVSAPVAAVSNVTSVSGPSTPFLTQLYSQDNDQDQNAVVQEQGARFAPAAAYNTLAGYSVIKYKPSNAGIPAAPALFPQPLPAQTAVPSPAISSSAAAVQATASSEAGYSAATPILAPSVQVALASYSAPATGAGANTPANDYQAYNTTQSRNASSLTRATSTQA